MILDYLGKKEAADAFLGAIKRFLKIT